MSDSILQVNQIKDKGGNATGITVADTTANVTINNLAGGTIGSNVVFPDAHKDIRKDDYILLGFATSTDFNGEQAIVSTSSSLWNEVYKGSGITHPYHPSSTAEYGRFKVSKAGVYLVWFNSHNESYTDDTNEVRLLRNGANLNDSGQSSDIAGNNGGRGYVANGAETRYVTGGTKIIVVPLNANDFLYLQGYGHWYGSATAPMGQFGAIRLGDRV